MIQVLGYVLQDRSGEPRLDTMCKWGCGIDFNDQNKKHRHEDKECLNRDYDVNRLKNC